MSYGVTSEATLVRPLFSILSSETLTWLLCEAASLQQFQGMPLDPVEHTDAQQIRPDSAMVAEYTAILSEMFQPRARNVMNQALGPYSNAPASDSAVGVQI